MAIASADTTISSTFAISASFASAEGSVTITNPGRSFRILQVVGTGTAASVITVKKNDNSGATAAIVTTDVTGEPMDGVLTLATVEFSATDNVFILVATQAATQCDIICVATGGGQVLTNAVA
jgi:hypothetical protein